MKQTRKMIKLFLDFVQFGCFTFGGGWSIIAQMRRKYVEEENSITDQELMDLASVAKSIPGVMIANMAMLFGCRTAGLAGGILCVVGMGLPPLIILIIISFFYKAFRTNLWVSATMEGLQAAVVPIISSAAIGLAKSSIVVPPCLIVTLVSLALYLFTDFSPLILVLIGGISGILMGDYYERKGELHHGAD